ncbi:MAG: ASCH domain-containing protein [Erysipelotrichaceae bacterium]|jgi:uncharacterized protein YhfF|nr:ASCH domain-containing protein [Erysipelotrichaceae bacterium]MBQ6217816.1 ASCH domain-containing protein [Erysipelotrichaceae bacterium]MBR3006019.1 ASCH domain-containing protein [Erysipelotrichaceae bacterium]MBR6233013.1 ASCH domain-containing protein [Erysipelotrichaceae bacterium]
MNAEELWKLSGLEGDYEAWKFGEACDELSDLVKRGIKTATSSSYLNYLAKEEKVPQAGDHSVILNSNDEAVCIIETIRVDILPFKDVDAAFAYLEGENDRSLEDWRRVHQAFFTKELKRIHREFDEDIPVVCEVFCLIETAPDKK